MAEINLGAIKFNWKGAYAGGTAYVVDDVVSYNGSSYVCILASTGNLPTNTTYWNVMAEGGDVATVLTTQGDILYRDGSGLQRLGAGTSGQALITNGTGANPSWGDTGGGLQSVQTFTSSGTYTKPSGINKIRVYVTGAGGGGGGSTTISSYDYQSGAGGGAGGTAIKLLDASSITTETVTIGSGGAVSSGGTGGNGGTSSFGSHCSATGGTGGVRPGAFNNGMPGGIGSSGDLNIRGQGGSGAVESNGGALTGGLGGTSFWGGGAGTEWSASGLAGELGGGGAGAAGTSGTARPGGAGGAGVVYVEEYK